MESAKIGNTKMAARHESDNDGSDSDILSDLDIDSDHEHHSTMELNQRRNIIY
jgi:hypothetical protein